MSASLRWIAGIAIVLAIPACGYVRYDATLVASDGSVGDAQSADADGESSDAGLDAARVDGSLVDAGVGGSLDAGAMDAGAMDTGPEEPGWAADFCEALPPLPAVPVIDGELEAGLWTRPLEPRLGWTGPGAGPPAEHQVQAAVAWRPGGLYVFLRVDDPTRLPAPPGQYRWCGDAVEVYVDSDATYATATAYDNPGARQLIVGAPMDDTTPQTGVESWCQNCTGDYPELFGASSYRSVPTAYGYAVEMWIEASHLGLGAWDLAAGNRIGFDFGVNVSTETATGLGCAIDGDQGTRLGQYFLHLGPSNEYPFDSPAAFCTPMLAP